MKKQPWLLLALFPILLMGCTGGSYAITIGEVTSSSDSISGEYSQFSGYYFKEVEFTEGDKIEFSNVTSTIDGTLSANLLNSSGQVIEELTNNTTITIPNKDTYRIQVDAKDHKGSFIISWSEVKQE